MAMLNVLVLTGYGLNCDHETAYAFERAGAKACRAHINSIIDGSVRLEHHHILVFVGGFGWGDDHGAGVIQAVRFKTHLGQSLVEFIHQGRLVLGICNGFQALVNLGLLPGFNKDYRSRRVALIHNECGNFRDQWVRLAVNPRSPCLFTQGIQTVDLPVRHGEGRFYADPQVVDQLKQNDQVVLRYARADGTPAGGRFPENPNGSVDDIAGICDPTGRVFGLMPHPEAYNDWTNHPDWLQQREEAKRKEKPFGVGAAVGIQIFQNAVRFMRAC